MNEIFWSPIWKWSFNALKMEFQRFSFENKKKQLFKTRPARLKPNLAGQGSDQT
jgi:hypothetical protein